MTFEQLTAAAYDNNAEIVEMDFDSGAKGLCIGKCIILSADLQTENEKSCILAEELGHYFTTVGNITGDSVSNRKQERTARGYAFDMMIGLSGLVSAWLNHLHTMCEVADYLGVTEKFLADALQYYSEKYGVKTDFDIYEIVFAPYFYIHIKGSDDIDI